MNDATRRFFFLAVACVAAYLVLHVLRSFGVDPEARGLWAGATGYVAAEIVTGRMRTTRALKAGDLIKVAGGHGAPMIVRFTFYDCGSEWITVQKVVTGEYFHIPSASAILLESEA